MVMKKKSNQATDNFDKFSGTIKEFVELMTPAMRLPAMIRKGYWMLGQTLYIKTTKRGPLITNRPIA